MLFIFKPYAPTLGSGLLSALLSPIGWRNHFDGVAVEDQFK